MTTHTKIDIITWYVTGICFALSLVLQFVTTSFFKSFVYINIPLHSFIETTGAIMALVIAYSLLSLKKLNRGPSHPGRIACALTAMGLFDGFHAASPVGNTFVWFHSIAIFAGGLFFVFMLLPDSIYNRFRKIWPFLSVCIVLLTGTFSFLASQNVPGMFSSDKTFSPAAILLNFGGGALFYIAAVYLIILRTRSRSVENVFFILFCLLIGTSAIMFQQSKMWDIAWWAWHLVKIIAYLSILRFVLLSQTRLINDSIKSKKKLETSLVKIQESERKYRNIFENVQDVFFQTSLEGNIINVSPSVKQHLGYSPDELIGTPVGKLYDKIEERENMLNALKATGETRDREIRFKSKKGDAVYISLNAIFIRDEAGNPSHLDGLFKNITDRKKAELELEETLVQLENRVIERTKELSDKNRDILDSIVYARRIQEAKLPKKEEVYSTLPDSFILFKPKDIVSGDFYFFHKSNSTSAFIAAADCTGHGVPGALMSMLGSEKLNDAVAQTTDTSQILKLLNKGIKTALRQSGEGDSTRDGMDIALCHLDTETKIINFAGANRPFWVIRKGGTEIEEIKPTKKAIGGLTEDEQHFESCEIHLQPGDTFYLSTDGYADTFGGENRKKLMTKKFKEILLSIQNKKMQDQERYLDDFIEAWKNRTEQVDDILVIGVRL